MHGRDSKSGEEYIMVTANQRVIMFTYLFCEDLYNTREVRMKENKIAKSWASLKV